MTDSFRFWLLVPLRSMEKLILSSAQCTCFREKPNDQGPNPGGRTFPAVGFDNLWNKSQMPIGFKIVWNPMAPYQESELLKRTDAATRKMIDLWHSVSEKVLGRPVEVVVDNRRVDPELRSILYEVNMARPGRYKEKVVLAVLLESFPTLKPPLITHEIGHWVLKLQGFRGMIRHPRDKEMEGLLNDVASRVPLYALQRSVGHDPQHEVDSRCDQDIETFTHPVPWDEVRKALYLADDLLNCSFDKREQLKSTLRRNHPTTLKTVERIVANASDYNLLNPEQNIAFRREIIREMKLEGEWSEFDDAKSFEEDMQEG